MWQCRPQRAWPPHAAAPAARVSLASCSWRVMGGDGDAQHLPAHLPAHPHACLPAWTAMCCCSPARQAEQVSTVLAVCCRLPTTGGAPNRAWPTCEPRHAVAAPRQASGEWQPKSRASCSLVHRERHGLAAPDLVGTFAGQQPLDTGAHGGCITVRLELPAAELRQVSGKKLRKGGDVVLIAAKETE